MVFSICKIRKVCPYLSYIDNSEGRKIISLSIGGLCHNFDLSTKLRKNTIFIKSDVTEDGYR